MNIILDNHVDYKLFKNALYRYIEFCEQSEKFNRAVCLDLDNFEIEEIINEKSILGIKLFLRRNERKDIDLFDFSILNYAVLHITLYVKEDFLFLPMDKEISKLNITIDIVESSERISINKLYFSLPCDCYKISSQRYLLHDINYMNDIFFNKDLLYTFNILEKCIYSYVPRIHYRNYGISDLSRINTTCNNYTLIIDEFMIDKLLIESELEKLKDKSLEIKCFDMENSSLVLNRDFGEKLNKLFKYFKIIKIVNSDIPFN